MYYVFGSRGADGNLTYFKDEFDGSIFKLDTMEEATAALERALSVNPKYELFRVIPASAKLCECP